MATSRRRVLLALGLARFKEGDRRPPPESFGSVVLLLIGHAVPCVAGAFLGVWLSNLQMGTAWDSSAVTWVLTFACAMAVLGVLMALHGRRRARRGETAADRPASSS